ncbi:hypothetical protein [Moraxella pluranimalium]|uniref:Uncharacterized protein n=1 Tax=Moraxella pluranimalium TaxID=470453 RepID=A0A1T0CMK6_9GAMM|nr:hypothetical protein [Moraxella pluranimalium]OOS23554.1 hypothetical protein B0680_06220 [Moraxella pluranimalium]
MKKRILSSAFLFVFLTAFINLSMTEVQAKGNKGNKGNKSAKEKTAQECKLYTDKINNQVPTVRNRYYDLLLDRYNLHAKHNSVKNAHPTYGSYQGHIQMYEKQRSILSTYITDAKLAQCGKYVSKDATTWSTKAAPTKPNKAEANAAGFR